MKITDYIHHFYKNFKVAVKAILLALFHFIHGLIPCKYTEHEYWNLSLTDKTISKTNRQL